LQALEGKDVKDLLLNVGSGGGAASAPAAGGAGAAEGAAEPEKEPEPEEGMNLLLFWSTRRAYTDYFHSQGRIRRGHGFRSFRLERFFNFPVCTFKCMATVFSVQHLAGRVAFHR
jgi:large subunit ribosomal protein LP1